VPSTQVSAQRTGANLGHQAAFFTMNGVNSVVFFLFVAADRLLNKN
jgi:hypothetical protein